MSYTCEWCKKQHTQDFSRTCPDCDFERESGDIHECKICQELYEGVCPCTKEEQA